MDSFYEQPRTAPIPTSTEKIPALPVVPEVSMIFQNNPKGTSSSLDSMYLPYNAWKAHNQNENSTTRNYYGNTLQPQHMQLRKLDDCGSLAGLGKQVRFESPTAVQQQRNFLPQSTKFSTVTNSNVPPQTCASSKRNMDEPEVLVNIKKPTKPFEQIYMANIPNRHLDLSIIDPPKATEVHKENISPNVNLLSKAYPFARYEDVDVKEKSDKNYQYNNSKDTRSVSPKFNQCNINETRLYDYTKQNNYSFKPLSSTQYKTDLMSDMQRIDDKNDLADKNNVIDLYNYRRDDLKALTAYGNRQSLDNSQTANNCNSNHPFDRNTKQPYPKPNLYESFDSHSCVSNKCVCSCTTNKEANTNTRNNAEIQTEPLTTSANPPASLEVDLINTSSDEPTVKDLLKIIHQQNDQLLVLQKQVASLLNNRDIPKQIEAPPGADRNMNLFGEKCRTSTQLEAQPIVCNPLQKSVPRKGPLPQFSLDVMTSFEVSIRRQQNLNRAYKDNINHQPKICEVTEIDSNVFDDHSHNVASKSNSGNVVNGICNNAKPIRDTGVSLTFNEPVHVPETCPTPDHTVRIEMDDYSSDDDEHSTNGEWLYNNVKGQVNHILKKSGMWPNCDSSMGSETSNDAVSQNVRRKVKEATIKHLKSIGVQLPTLDDTNDIPEADSHQHIGCNPKEISFAVKQLLMKYLPNEQLAKLAYTQTQKITPQESTEPVGLIKRRPEFSFATVQYMQKYNLLTDVPKDHRADFLPQMQQVVRQEENFDRILDASAIRQQPKLL